MSKWTPIISRSFIALVLVVLASACTLLGQSSEAIDANNRGFDYYEQGDLEQAILEYDKAIELDPAFSPAYFNRGLAYYDQGDLEQAIAELRAILSVSDDPYFRQLAEEQLEMLGETP